jgi:hypothetical protein
MGSGAAPAPFNTPVLPLKWARGLVGLCNKSSKEHVETSSTKRQVRFDGLLRSVLVLTMAHNEILLVIADTHHFVFAFFCDFRGAFFLAPAATDETEAPTSQSLGDCPGGGSVIVLSSPLQAPPPPPPPPPRPRSSSSSGFSSAWNEGCLFVLNHMSPWESLQ